MAHALKQRYDEEIVPAMMKVLDLDNVMEVPRIKKVVVNIGMGEADGQCQALDAAVGDLTQINGQKPAVTKARKSIANFKLREGRDRW
jgi:large subunit ribosomal protein L5